MGDNRFLEHNDSLCNHAPCGLLTFRIDGTILHGNKTLLNWLKITQEELTTTTFVSLLDNGGRFYYQLFVLPLLRMHHEVNEISFQIQKEDVNFSCLFSASVFTAGNSKEMQVCAVIYKVVDRKKYEAELLLKKAKSDAERLLSQERLRIVALAQSHLVRAPLANILGLAALLQDMESDKEIKQLTAMLQESAKKLDVEIRKIVDAASDNSQQG
ncbi:hypothetical protein HH214_04790 [Mucilaginibacter robiniae]|uniref:PAS domain-containing protein n=1 Tax=Mucilaginibacter robiniae TaxID=2728022 RepID=A0A7L5DVX1_9SPHI|nr:hypothetical protein [Mucilaginibacter robiniae]QJD95240.1 hypothetical protein HH214_04790 [Mucilaginibacter robiniae]